MGTRIISPRASVVDYFGATRDSSRLTVGTLMRRFLYININLEPVASSKKLLKFKLNKY